MTTELERIKAEVAFYNEIGPLHEELEAAREVKADDPVRFAEAKQAFEEKRTYYRQIGEFLAATAKAEADESNVTIHVGEVAEASAEAIPPFDGGNS